MTDRRTIYYPFGHCPLTPWGNADSKTEYGLGVNFYSTPSHGGFRVSGKALQRIPEKYRQTKYAPYGWFEEDCDWSIVAYFLPEFFDVQERDAALETLSRYHPEILVETRMLDGLT